MWEGAVARRTGVSPARPVLLRCRSRSFYTRDQRVDSPADLVGLKIRTQESATAMRMVRALGGSATPISWGELYTALQQGVVDGAENNPPSFYLSRHYEVCSYYSLDEHTSVPDVLLMSTRVWDDLDPQVQLLVEEAALEAAEYQKVIWAEASDEAWLRSKRQVSRSSVRTKLLSKRP